MEVISVWVWVFLSLQMCSCFKFQMVCGFWNQACISLTISFKLYHFFKILAFLYLLSDNRGWSLTLALCRLPAVVAVIEISLLSRSPLWNICEWRAGEAVSRWKFVFTAGTTGINALGSGSCLLCVSIWQDLPAWSAHLQVASCVIWLQVALFVFIQPF